MTGPLRDCDGCTLCCKVLGIRGADSPQHSWCMHCSIDQGCSIYADRPQDCRDFHCMYLLAPLPDHWMPARAHMVLCSDPSVPRIEVHVDADHPDVWLQEAYYGDLRQWAQGATQANGFVIVYLPDRAIAILPHKYVDLRQLAPDAQIVNVTRMTAQGPMPDVELVGADAPPPAPGPTITYKVGYGG